MPFLKCQSGVGEIALGRVGSLTRIVLCWSLFTAMTGAMFDILAASVIVRFLFGAGEAGAFPNAAASVSRGSPASSRAGARARRQRRLKWAGRYRRVVAAYLINSIGWRWTILILRVGWRGCGRLAFYVWFRDEPGRAYGGK